MPEELFYNYDQVLYPNYLHRQTHPERLATIARFHGVKPQAVENCRVLEFGCGTGNSLLAFAMSLPNSEFIGLDSSARQIERAVEGQKFIGLKNLTFLQEDILEINREKLGKFDYLIAHGIYSWTPENVRDRLLRLCREMLNEQGVAFVSYNTFPGCHFRLMMREMMLFHTRNPAPPIKKVSQAIALLNFLAEAVPPEFVHKAVFRQELEKIMKYDASGILHDDLAEFFFPLYFHEFIKHAESHNLQFLSESEDFSNQNVENPSKVNEILSELGDDLITREQYIDFIICRRFRQTLLCHREITLRREPDAGALSELRIASPLRPAADDKPKLASDKIVEFVGEKRGEKIEINHPLTKAALFYLGKIWMRSTGLEEVLRAAQKLLDEEKEAEFQITEKDKQILNDIFLRLYAAKLLELRSFEPQYAEAVSEKPLASPLARWQAMGGDRISTFRFESFTIEDAITRKLITLLDGSRNRETLLDNLTEFVKSERGDEKILHDLPEILETRLSMLAELALLVS